MLKSLLDIIAETTGGVRALDSSSAREEMRGNRGVLVDVRESGEVEQRPAPGSHNISRGILEMKITELCPDAESPIYLHCASGGRARLAAEQLRRMGYQNVTAISCGLDAICEAFDNA